ncbi:MAG: hypothetical protein Q9214_001248, partial [Letrouitia sp. 1 TL-2023]
MLIWSKYVFGDGFYVSRAGDDAGAYGYGYDYRDYHSRFPLDDLRWTARIASLSTNVLQRFIST